MRKGESSLLHNFDLRRLIVIRDLKSMKVHDCRSNVREAGVLEVVRSLTPGPPMAIGTCRWIVSVHELTNWGPSLSVSELRHCPECTCRIQRA
jgi:hypothetical protein